MKYSGVEWIGNIPDNWEIRKVKQCFYQSKEQAHIENPTVLSLARAGVKVRDISTNEGQLAASYDNYNPVQPGDLLLNPMDLYSGANCSLSEVSGVISPAYVNLRKKVKLNSKYYDYYFKTQYWTMAMFAHGKGVSFDNRWTMNSETMMNYYIPYPCYEVQNKIVETINEKLNEINSLIEIENKQIERLNDYKKSLILETVTKGLDKEVSLKESGITWAGKIPINWEIACISYLTTSRSGATPDRNDLSYWRSGTIPWMASGEVNYGIVNDTKERVTEKAIRECSCKIIKKNSIMVALNGQGKTKGMSAILAIDAACNQSLCAFTCDSKKLYYKFLDYCFKSMYKFLRSQSGDNLRDGLAASFVKKQRIPFPDICTQEKIANFLDIKCTEIDALVSIKQEKIGKLNDYKKSLIYEYVIGKKEVC